MALIKGNSFNNKLIGTAGNDLLYGLGGNDSLNGGAGFDTAWFSGNSGGYHFSSIGGQLVVRDSAPLVGGMEGTDSLKNIEQLQFSNAQFTLSPSEFQVNTFTTSSQFEPSIAALADGGFIVSWSSFGQDGSNSGIYAQRYNAAGVAQGAEFQVNTFTASEQFQPSIAALADGGWVVSWTSPGQDGDSFGIYAQRYNAAGVAQGAEFRVNSFTANNQSQPSITALADGGWVVSWTSQDQDDVDGAFGIYAQRYNAAGVAQGVEFRVNTFTANNQLEPSITALVDGGWVVSWTSNGQDGSGSGIYAQRYNAAGVAQGAEFQVNSFTTSEQVEPSITALADGGWVVSWSSLLQDGSSNGIYAQRYNAAGLAQGAEFQVNTFTTSFQDQPSITALADGGWVVSWTSAGQDGDRYGIYAQRYNAAGVAQGAEFQVNSFTTGDQLESSITALADGGWVVSWTSNGQDGSGRGIYAQRYDAAGNAVGLKLTGTAAADTINLDAGQLMTVDGAAGNDTLNGSSGNDMLLGGANNDTLSGNAGNDYLDGGTGVDNMAGGAGDDVYFIDSALDVLTEAIGAGNDTMNSSVTKILAANFENLTLTGLDNINGTGNAIGNVLEGNSGNNVLNGLAGADIMSGGAGKDTYIVDNSGDYVDELIDSGIDAVNASTTFLLADNIENLTLTGALAINGTGNGLANILTGNAAANNLAGQAGDDRLSGLGGSDNLVGGDGNDTLAGGAGNDNLFGGANADTFVFNTALSATTNLDSIFDFNAAGDTIFLSKAIFTALGGTNQALFAGEFVVGSNASAPDDRIIYNNSTGDLFYDSDGSGVVAAIKFATLIGVPTTITAADFFVIA